MATILFLHAHPDDECLISGGTIANSMQAGYPNGNAGASARPSNSGNFFPACI